MFREAEKISESDNFHTNIQVSILYIVAIFDFDFQGSRPQGLNLLEVARLSRIQMKHEFDTSKLNLTHETRNLKYVNLKLENFVYMRFENLKI